MNFTDNFIEQIPFQQEQPGTLTKPSVNLDLFQECLVVFKAFKALGFFCTRGFGFALKHDGTVRGREGICARDM